jgi:hypothetical protein
VTIFWQWRSVVINSFLGINGTTFLFYQTNTIENTNQWEHLVDCWTLIGEKRLWHVMLVIFVNKLYFVTKHINAGLLICVNCIHKKMEQIVFRPPIPHRISNLWSCSGVSWKLQCFPRTSIDYYAFSHVRLNKASFVSKKKNPGSNVCSFTNWINQLQKCFL